MRGYCGKTHRPGDCAAGDKGFWMLNSTAASSWDAAHKACQEHCLACPRCSTISFSLRHRDCSWYSACPQLELNNLGKTYRTRLVRPETQPPPGGELRGSAPAPSVV